MDGVDAQFPVERLRLNVSARHLLPKRLMRRPVGERLHQTSADPGAFDVFATLPTGFRPAYDQHAPLMRANWGGADKNVALKVLQNGDLVLNEAAPAVAVTYLAINFTVPLD
jgi:hypothetical protein